MAKNSHQKVPKSDFQSRFSMDHMDGSKPGKGLGRYFIKIPMIFDSEN